MEGISPGTQMAMIRNFEKGFVATHLIHIGAKLGIFEALNEVKEGMTIPDLASKLGLHEPYLKTLCQTAYHFQILDCDDQGRFILQPFLDEILADKSHFRNYLGNIALTVDIVGEVLKDAPVYYRTGKTIENLYTPEVSNVVSETTKNIHIVFFSMIFPKNDQLKQMLDRGVRFLDIGCGRGNLIIQLAQVFKNSTFIGVDPDTYGIEEAKKKIIQAALEERVSVENTGGEALLFNDEFDMASMIVTLHEIRPEVRVKIVEKAYHALKNDGLILILDFPYPSKLKDFRNPNYDFGILDQFIEACAGIVHLNTYEQNEMLMKVGFRNIQRMTIGKRMFEFVTATK